MTLDTGIALAARPFDLMLGGGIDQPMLAYRFSTIKTPAAIARIAMRVPSPEKLRLSSGISPVKMSQMPNKSMPRFVGSFIRRFLSANELRVSDGKRGMTRRRLTPKLSRARLRECLLGLTVDQPRDPSVPVPPALVHHLPDYEQHDGADERQEEAGRVEHRAIRRSVEEASHEAAGDRAGYSEPGRHPEAHDVDSRHERASNQSDHETDYDRPQNVQHGGLLWLNGIVPRILSWCDVCHRPALTATPS